MRRLDNRVEFLTNGKTAFTGRLSPRLPLYFNEVQNITIISAGYQFRLGT